MEIIKIKVNANDSYTYIYDNGIKVVYKKNKRPETSVEVKFLGGSSVQGKYMGLAHLTEHTVFLDRKLKNLKVYAGGSTAMNETDFEFLVRTETREKTQQTEEALKKIENTFSVFAEEITNTDFDINNFENEKKVINQESNQKRHFDNFNSVYDPHYNKYVNCGDEQTLKHITPKDVIDYKKKFYTKENMTIFITSHFDFCQIEPMIKSSCQNIFSNPKTKLKTPTKTFDVMNSSSYYINKDSAENTNNDDPAVSVCYVVSNNNSNLDNKTRLVGNALLGGLLLNASKRKEYLRQDNPLIYSSRQFKEASTDYSTAFRYEFNIVNKNLRKTLLYTSKLINNLTTFVDDDFFLNIIKHPEQIYNCIPISNNLKLDEYNMSKEEFFQYKNEFKEFFMKNQNNPKVIVDELKKCLKETIDASTISVVLSKNVKEENLPDIKYLEEIVKGKTERNLKQDLEPNRTKPVVFDPYKRNLPAMYEEQKEPKNAKEYLDSIFGKQTKQELLTK